MSPELNFPEGISALVRCVEQKDQLKIWGACRKKWLVFTPEEWVRQHCIHYLNALGYPLSLMQTEGGLKTVQRTKRSDLLIYKNKIPFILVECKAPTVRISQQTFNQAFNYNTEIKASFIYLTNGVQHFYWDVKNNAQLSGLPSADDLSYE
jgi:hypothetical protein